MTGSAHAYLFSGPRGTGKTTSARILAKALNCLEPKNGEPCDKCESCVRITAGSSLDVQELDAASNNGVDAMRDLVEPRRAHHAGTVEGVHRRRGPHAVGRGVERAAEDARGAAEPRRVRPGHDRSAEGPADGAKPHAALTSSACCRVMFSPGSSATWPEPPSLRWRRKSSRPRRARARARHATRCRRSTRSPPAAVSTSRTRTRRARSSTRSRSPTPARR